MSWNDYPGYDDGFGDMFDDMDDIFGEDDDPFGKDPFEDYDFGSDPYYDDYDINNEPQGVMWRSGQESNSGWNLDNPLLDDPYFSVEDEMPDDIFGDSAL